VRASAPAGRRPPGASQRQDNGRARTTAARRWVSKRKSEQGGTERAECAGGNRLKKQTTPARRERPTRTEARNAGRAGRTREEGRGRGEGDGGKTAGRDGKARPPRAGGQRGAGGRGRPGPGSGSAARTNAARHRPGGEGAGRGWRARKRGRGRPETPQTGATQAGGKSKGGQRRASGQGAGAAAPGTVAGETPTRGRGTGRRTYKRGPGTPRRPSKRGREGSDPGTPGDRPRKAQDRAPAATGQHRGVPGTARE